MTARPGDTLVCESCHKAHDAPAPEGILVASNEGSALCTGCHRDQAPVAQPGHLRREGAAQAVGWALYGVVVGYGVASSGYRSRDASPWTLAAAFPVMHMAWGAGFIRTVLGRILGGRQR